MSETEFRRRAVWAAKDDERGWDSDEFEDQVAATVVGLHEKPSLPPRVEIWPTTFQQRELEQARGCGAYVCHPSRVVFEDELDAPLDSIYAGPMLHSMINRGLAAGDGYRYFYFIKRAPAVPRPFYATGPGTPYSFTLLCATQSGRLEALKEFFTADGKRINVAAFDHGKTKRWPYVTVNPLLGETHAKVTEKMITTTVNFAIDRRHVWSIAALDSSMRVSLGCYHEEVKSLLYARSLPLTATGRKRPILHLVAAHRRRLTGGIEIDINEFLRGVRKVEVHGAVFEVEEPAASAEAMAARRDGRSINGRCMLINRRV